MQPRMYKTGEDKQKIHFTDQNISSYNINLTMAFFKWPIKIYISKSGDGVFTTANQSARTIFLLIVNIWLRWLRIDIDASLGWQVLVDTIGRKVSAGLEALKRVLSLVPQQTLVTMYEALVAPYFDYCSEV